MTLTVASTPLAFQASPIPTLSQPRPASITGAIIDRLPDLLGFSDHQSALVSPWVQDQVLGVLGRFLTISVHGLTLFEVPSPWLYLGMKNEAVRTSMMKGRPKWRLADEKLMLPFRNLEQGARNLPRRYHAFWVEERDCWYVPFKVEAQLVEAFTAYQAKWVENRDKLLANLPEHKLAGLARLRRAAEEAYEALRASGIPDQNRAQFTGQILDWYEQRFPTELAIRERLNIDLVDKKRPDEHPSQDIVERVLGLKDAVEAEARAATATAEKAETEAAAAAQQLELAQVRTHTERQMIEAMIQRRLESEKARIEHEAEKNVAPLLALIRNARETIGSDIASLLGVVREGKELSAASIKRLRKVISAYQLVSAGEVELDDKVAALEQIANQPRLSRSSTELKTLMEDIAAMTAVEVARLKDAQTQSWDGLFAMVGTPGEASHEEI